MPEAYRKFIPYVGKHAPKEILPPEPELCQLNSKFMCADEHAEPEEVKQEVVQEEVKQE